MKLRRRLAVPIALALLAVPAAAAGSGGTAASVHGAGDLEVQAAGGWLRVPLVEGVTATLEAGSVQRTLVDDVYTLLDDPSPNGDLRSLFFSEFDREYSNRSLGATSTWLEAVNDPDAVLFVLPGDHDLDANHSGRYSVASIEEELLEESHAVGPDSSGLEDFYYHHTATDTLRTALDGQTTTTVTGDFTVYLWGGSTAGDDPLRTGTWTDADPDNPLQEREHHAFVLLQATDAVLTIETTNSPTTMYDDGVQTTVQGTSHYTALAGNVPTDDGTYAVDGDATIYDGTASWSVGGTGIDVAFDDPATGIASRSATPIPAPAAERDLAWLTGLVLVTAAACVYAIPNLVGRVWARRMRGLLDDGHAPDGWKSRRAEGFHRIARAAEKRGQHRLAVAFGHRAVRWEPDNPDMLTALAVYWRQAGSPIRARDVHRRVHQLLQGTDESEDRAHNAVEAARACAAAGDRDAAVRWLHIVAANAEHMLQSVDEDPDLGGLTEHPGVISLRKSGLGKGWMGA